MILQNQKQYSQTLVSEKIYDYMKDYDNMKKYSVKLFYQ